LAFTTIPGSGAAATTIVGTSGVDLGSITNVDKFFVGAQQDADVIGVTSNLSNGTIKGGQGADTISFTAGASITTSFVNSNANNDSIGQAGATANFFTSTVLGGQGNDTFTLGSVNSSTVNGNKGGDNFAAGGILNASTLFGGQGNDTVAAVTAGSDSTIRGDLGNDRLTAGGGNFTNTAFNGGEGNDAVSINASTAATNTFTNNTVNGGAGADTITSVAARAISSGTVINGDAGIDTINFATFTQAVTIDGGSEGDNITSGTAADNVSGGAGNDTIINTNAATSNDTITGGAGADSITTSALGTAEQINQNVGDSVAATGGLTNLTVGGLLQATSTIVFDNGVDVVTNALAATDNIATGIANTVLGNLGVIADGVTSTAVGGSLINMTAAVAGNYLIRGTYTAGTGTFTTAAAGADLLFIQTAGGDLTNAANIGTSSMVLTGAQAATTSADIIV